MARKQRSATSAPGAAKLPDTFGGMTLDGWANFVSGLGDISRDKRLANRMCVVPVGIDEARAIYRGSDMGARLIEARVKEMWRPGFEITIKDLKADPSDAEDDRVVVDPSNQYTPVSINRYGGMRADSKPSRRIARRMRQDAVTQDMKTLTKRAMRKWRKLRGKKRFREAQHYANAYGGGAVLIGARDGQASFAEPLDVNKVTSIDFLTSLESREMTPIAWYENPLEDKFGEPMMYQITPVPSSGAVSASSIIYVHETRLVIFDGVRVARNMSTVLAGWGDSLFTRVKQVMSDLDMGFASVGILLQEISIACMKIKGLAESALTDAGRKKIFARMAAYAMAKSIANLSLIDADGEEFTRTNAAVSGVADLLQMMMQRVAAAFDMPVTVLMGMSPAGLNATGASDIRQWYDDIASEREDKLDEPMHFLIGLILRTLNGGIEPADWCIDWGSMWEESPKEKADTRLVDATSDEKNILNGIYTSTEARKSRFGGGKYGTEIVIDQDDDTTFDPAAVDDYKASLTSTKPPVDPVPGVVDPKAPVTAAPAADIQKSAMNGAQFQAMLQIAEAVNTKAIARESGQAMLMIGMNITAEEANSILGPDTFVMVKPDPPPSPFGGGLPKDPATPPKDPVSSEAP